MNGQGAAKNCVMCGQDCTGKPRTRDKSGRYFCNTCFEKALAAKSARQAQELNARTASDTHANSHSDLDAILAEHEPSAQVLDDVVPAPPTPQPKPRNHDPRKCPACEHVIAVGAVLCTNCGYNVTSGVTLNVNPTGLHPNRVPRRQATTNWGAIAAALGAVGLCIDIMSMSRSHLIMDYAPDLGRRPEFVMILSILANLGLLAAGGLMLLQQAQSLSAAVASFALCMAGQVVWLLMATLSPQAGEPRMFESTLAIAAVVIRLLAIAVLAAFYMALLKYLRQPATRVEFGTK